MTAKTQSPLTVYYDGACPVCRREIGFYQKRTGEAVSYCDVAAEVCPAPDLRREDALERFHVRLADGSLVSGAAAFLALWRETPGFRRAGALLSSGPVVAVLDKAYAGFLRLRRLWR
jgi:predicted DCC family thiol-disulfide oxidoreductase YuxK